MCIRDRTTCEITATVLLVVFLYDNFGLDWALFGAAIAMVLISFVVIGVGPRTLGRQHAYTIALTTALPLQVISALLKPIPRMLVLLGNAITPGRGLRNGPFASEIELREVVDLAQQRGVVAADERRMIESVFELGDTPAREVMVPRTEMIWIESDKSAAQATTLAVRSGHSRIPVIGENVDDIVGVVYLKDLVQQTFLSADGGSNTNVSQVMRPAVFVPDSKPLDACLLYTSANVPPWCTVSPPSGSCSIRTTSPSTEASRSSREGIRRSRIVDFGLRIPRRPPTIRGLSLIHISAHAWLRRPR